MTVEIYSNNSLVLSHEFQPRVTGLSDNYSAACGSLDLSCVGYDYTDSGARAGTWNRDVRIVATANAGYTFEKYRCVRTLYRQSGNPEVDDDEYTSNIYDDSGTYLGELESYYNGDFQYRREIYIAFYFRSRTYTHLPLRNSSGSLLRSSSSPYLPLRDG
ncbi:MAG: hypothetical protein IJQ34_02220 [Kiritimatiellae bacterium]|nr:hypothetical protein [Kiritimatiellia bacterium]